MSVNCCEFIQMNRIVDSLFWERVEITKHCEALFRTVQALDEICASRESNISPRLLPLSELMHYSKSCLVWFGGC